MGSQRVGEGEKPSSNSGHEEDVLEKLKQSVHRTLNSSMRDMLHACLEEQNIARSQGSSRVPSGSSRSSQESYEAKERREYGSHDSSRDFEEDTKESVFSGNDSKQEDAEQVGSSAGIEEYICSVLGLPGNAYKQYKETNASAEFLTELLRFRIEQEKTKQDSLKHQFTILTLDILRFAKSLNLDRDLIPLLFVSNKSLDDLKTQVHQFQKEPDTLIKDLINIVQSQDIGRQWDGQDKTKMEPSPKPSECRLLPSFSETEEIIRRPSSVETPHASSPNKSPDIEHKRLNAFPSSIERSHSYSSRQCSPSSMPFSQQGKYPKLNLQGHFASKPNTHQLNTSLPVPQFQHKNEVSRSPENKSMNSPESPKYVPYMVPSSTQNYSPMSGSNYLQPQARYPYIFPLSSRNNQQGKQPHSYMMSSSAPIGVMPPTMSSSSYNYNPRATDKTKRTSSLKEEDYSESQYHYKRPRHGKSGFNFMISTPKNPPANKYNNNAAKDHPKK